MKTKIEQIVIYNGRGKKEESSAILFDESGIIAVGREVKNAEAEATIDGTGLTCMPGWVQSHSHIALDGLPNMQAQVARDNNESAVMASAVRNCLRCLKSGLVSVRDMGTAFDVSIKLRNAVNEGKILGPYIYAPGRVICMTGGHGADFGIEVDGADEARKAARGQIKRGADHLKIMATGGGQSKGMKAGVPQLSFEEIKAIAEEAQHAGLPTAAHAQGKEGVMNCLHAGVDSIEHGVTLDDEQIELMVKQKTFFCPTLLGLWLVIENGVASGIPQYVVDKCKIQAETHFSGFEKAYKAGVRILVGTDAGIPFTYQDNIAGEFDLMHKFGVSVRDIITAVTYTPAQALNVSNRTGSIEPGKRADLTIIKGDPENDINAFKDVVMVYKQGKKLYSKENGEDRFAAVL